MTEVAELLAYHQSRADKLWPHSVPKPYISPFRGQELHECISRPLTLSDAEREYPNYVSDDSELSRLLKVLGGWHKITCQQHGLVIVKSREVYLAQTEPRSLEVKIAIYANETHEFNLLIVL